MSPSRAMLSGSYDYRLVVLSVGIAIFASYAALDLAGRVTVARGWARSAWLGGGAAAMGLGIWSMHYIGMLALNMSMPVAYDWPTVLLSPPGGDLCIGHGFVRGQPPKDALMACRRRQPGHGCWDRLDALHRYGGNADGCHDSLQRSHRDVVGGSGGCDFIRRNLAGF